GEPARQKNRGARAPRKNSGATRGKERIRKNRARVGAPARQKNRGARAPRKNSRATRGKESSRKNRARVGAPARQKKNSSARAPDEKRSARNEAFETVFRGGIPWHGARSFRARPPP